ncbi:MAG TPA: PAS domain S-box protein [Pirellulales bacterium]|jgi:PAS domain S-box-containing protein|nr:PAS domain S-box protein [Pirellulales bacterium]
MSSDLSRFTKAQLLQEVLALRGQLAAHGPVRLDQELNTFREELQGQTEQLLEAQELLEQSRDQYADLYDFAPVAYVTLDHAGLVRNINLTGADLLGCERANILHVPLLQYIAADDRRAFLDHLLYCRQGESPRSIELCLRSRSGKVVPVQLVTRRITSIRGADIEFRTALVDITQRRQVEETVRCLNAELEQRVELRTAELGQANRRLASEVAERRAAEDAARLSEQYFRQLADAIPQIVWISDAQGRLQYLNRGWFEMTGLSEQESFGPRAWQQVTHADDIPRLQAAWQKAVETGGPLELEVRLLDLPSGGFRWHLTRAVPMRDAAGQIVRWFGTATDIASQKEAEQTLHESSRRKDEFLAMLGHELRNPLAASISALALLGDADIAADTADQAYAIINRQLQIMSRLIDDLLDLDRVRRGKIALRRQPADLTGLVRRAAAAAKKLAEARGQELTSVLPAFPVVVELDATRIEQVIANLLQNAVKYTPRGGQIRLELTAETPAATVSVGDNGRGMEPAFLERAFEMFAQAEQTADRPQGGLGIGLTMVRSLVELHGGRVSADSAGLGLGSRLVFQLPWDGCTQLPDDPGLAGESGNLPAAASPRRVLIVEDNPDVAKTLELVLLRMGCDVHLVDRGDLALAAVEQLRPEVLLLDIGLPGIDGYEVARRVRRHAGISQPMLVALTGYGLPDDRRRAEEAGFDHYLTKPVSAQQLKELLTAELLRN